VNYHISDDFSATAFLLSDYPDEDGRFMCSIRLSGTSPRGKTKAQVIYGNMTIDELADIVDDPHEAAYPR
jgi:hypothetical protein